MTALDVISLVAAKEYLRVDYPDQDGVITRNIKSAVSLIEQYTDVMLYERERTYVLLGCSLEIYDSPITFTGTLPTKTKQMAMSVIIYGKSGETFTANVGYSDPNEIPQNLVDACYKMITYLYENRDAYSVALPADVQMLINQFRRSATI